MIFYINPTDDDELFCLNSIPYYSLKENLEYRFSSILRENNLLIELKIVPQGLISSLVDRE